MFVAFRYVIGLTLASAVYAASTVVAFAVEAPANASSDALMEIVVTAQYRRENLQDTPIAITAVTGQMMEDRNQKSLVDLTAAAPNVTLTQASSGFGNSATASIRGVGQNDFNFALEPGVGIYIDDVYYGALFGSVFDLTDLDRAEVERGPQGTLSGKNSIGGSVKLYTVKPTGDDTGFVEAAAGNLNRRELRGAGDFTVIPDTLFVRFSGSSKQVDGYLKRLDYNCANGIPSASRTSDNCVLGTEGGIDSRTLRASVLWRPTDTIEDNFIVDSLDDTSEAPATKLIVQGPWAGTNNYITCPHCYTNYATYTGYPGTANSFTVPTDNTVHGYGFSNNLSVGLPYDLHLTLISAFRRATGEFGSDLDASPAADVTQLNEVAHRQHSEELRLSGTYQIIDWTTGLYYYDSHDKIAGRISDEAGLVAGGGLIPLPGGGGVPLIDFVDNDSISTISKSAFAHVVAHATDGLSLIGGVRYTIDSKDYTFIRDIAGLPPSAFGPLLAMLTGDTGRYSGKKTDYRLSAEYRWTPEIMTYAEYSTGYKGGGVNPRPFFASQLLPFKPETLHSSEIGIKTDLLDRKMRANIAAFYNTYDDIQLTALVCPFAPVTPCALPVNAGNADVKGVELEWSYRPVEALTFDASASWLKFDYTSINSSAGSPAVGDTPAAGVQRGMITPFTPTQKYSAGAQYVFSAGGFGSVAPRLDWSYQSAIYTNATNGPTNLIAGYGLLTGRITWRDAKDRWQVAIWGTNLLNRFYYVNGFDEAAAPFFDTTAQPGAPREYAITLKRNF